jgi:hypothetical protein
MSVVFGKLNGIETLIVVVCAMLCITGVLISIANALGAPKHKVELPVSKPVIHNIKE